MQAVDTRVRPGFSAFGLAPAEKTGPFLIAGESPIARPGRTVHRAEIRSRRRPRWGSAAAVLVGVLVCLWSQPPIAEDRVIPTRAALPPQFIHDAKTKPIWQSVDGHSIRYLLSLPKDWSPDRRWPVIVVITGSSSNFPIIAQGYHDVRGDRPFIVITPATVSSGSKIDTDLYPHLSQDELARLAAASVREKLAYDMAGLERILAEVGEKFAGDSKAYLSGFSMGGTLAWQMALLRSDLLHMAFPVCAMYKEEASGLIPAGHRPANPALPIRAFQGEKDPWLDGFDKHWERASGLAKQAGFQDVTRTVTGRGHSWYYGEILELCAEHHAALHRAAPPQAVPTESRP
jgi:predicted esterase